MTAVLRQQGLTVGIIAADPTSPFSGGAILGDRIRMQQHYLDAGVFIRSMATREIATGLPPTAKDVMKLMDAAGKDIILVETVGVGQTELDIETTDTTIVLLVPEAGDAIQTLKAGLMEIADIFVVNKADRDGADRLMAELRMMREIQQTPDGWDVPIVATQAIVVSASIRCTIRFRPIAVFGGVWGVATAASSPSPQRIVGSGRASGQAASDAAGARRSHFGSAGRASHAGRDRPAYRCRPHPGRRGHPATLARREELGC